VLPPRTAPNDLHVLGISATAVTSCATTGLFRASRSARLSMGLPLGELEVLHSQALMILVVDHDPEALEKARDILNCDRQVFLASSAKEALALVQRLGFSVVLVDLDLPGDGYALIQKLHDANPELLIIAISGALKASVLEATKDIGVVEVLKKPITSAWKPVVERIRARRLLEPNSESGG